MIRCEEFQTKALMWRLVKKALTPAPHWLIQELLVCPKELWFKTWAWAHTHILHPSKVGFRTSVTSTASPHPSVPPLPPLPTTPQLLPYQNQSKIKTKTKRESHLSNWIPVMEFLVFYQKRKLVILKLYKVQFYLEQWWKSAIVLNAKFATFDKL